MRLARVRRASAAPVELVVGVDSEHVVSLATVPGCEDADPLAALERFGTAGLAEHVTRATDQVRTGDLLFEPPVARCSKVCCLALNYRAHAAESNMEVPPNPVLFFKPPSALIGHRRVIRPPARTRHVEHEVELAVVIGKPTRDLDPHHWRDAVAGYTVINDMTARDLQLANIGRNQPWDQAKGFDTFAPVGPFLVTPDEIDDPQSLDMTLTVAGEVRQQANTKQMVFDIPRLLADLSDGMTLLPGDLIATGTTAGIAPVAHGDVMHASIAGIGTLINSIEWSANDL
jgi:5-oxopent-3-ene-1,2,5-tricarboxylate decarboxylase/2-hydroxyhepta-2,4-diene-1,7-dioate isomerase